MKDQRIDKIEKRLRELERFLPVLREAFSGEIGPPFPSMETLIQAKMRENALPHVDKWLDEGRIKND